MLQQLQVHRQVTFHLANDYLEPLSGNFERLAYLAELQDPKTGQYRHDRLEAVYGATPVHEVAEKSHQELFERILETPLVRQEADLRVFLQSQPGGIEEALRSFANRMKSWIPAGSPDYLKDLFRCNLEALRELLQEQPPKAGSDK
jgi:hypothetical protein